MPCLDEVETVATCVDRAVAFLADHHIDGEVVVADNGSTDGSQHVAEAAGARVVSVPGRGYGTALLGGIKAARGKRFLPQDPKASRVLPTWSLERGLWVGGLLASAGLTVLVTSFARWHSTEFGRLDYDSSVRVVVPSVTALIVSCQVILGTFFLAVLRIRQAAQPVLLDAPHGARALARSAKPDLRNPNKQSQRLIVSSYPDKTICGSAWHYLAGGHASN